MRDINFFNTYQSVQKEKTTMLKYFYIAFGTILIVSVISCGSNFIRMFILSSQIDSYTEQLEESSVKEKLAQAEKINSEISILQEYDKNVTNILSKLKDRDCVSHQLMNELNSTIPSGVHYKRLDLDGNALKITGISSDMDYVGELEHNLKQLNIMNNVFVKSINKSDSVAEEYSFEIECLLKDVR